jgi:hypothetical protein
MLEALGRPSTSIRLDSRWLTLTPMDETYGKSCSRHIATLCMLSSSTLVAEPTSESAPQDGASNFLACAIGAFGWEHALRRIALAGALALCVGVAMWAPSTAAASTPLVTDTYRTHVQGETDATLKATLNPIDSLGVSYEIGYEEAGGAFCDGQTEQPAYELNEGEYTGTEPTEISIPLALWEHMEFEKAYCARVIASTPSAEEEAIITEVGNEVVLFPSTPEFIEPDRIDGTYITAFFRIGFGGVEEGIDNAEYAPQDSTWCRSSGNEGSPEATEPHRYGTPGQPFWQMRGWMTVTAGEKYCARLHAHGEYATVYFPFVEWEEEYPAKNIGVEYEAASGEEVVHAEINPEFEATAYAIKYAPANSSFCGGSENSGEGSQPVVGHEYELNVPEQGWEIYDPVTISSNEFVSGERYCANIHVRKPSGQPLPGGESEKVFFTAGPAAEAPSATTARASSITESNSVLVGSVDPGGAASSFAVDYAPESSAWCQGNAGAAVSESAAGSVAEGVTPVGVEHEITGLDPDSEYCAEIVAINAQGKSIATGKVTFKTLAAKLSATENLTAVLAPNPPSPPTSSLPALRRARAPRTELVHGHVVLKTGYDITCPRGSCTTKAAAIKYVLLSKASAMKIKRGTVGSVRFALGVRGAREIVITFEARGKRMLKARRSLRMALRVVIAGGGLAHPSTTIEVLHAPRPHRL